MLFLCFATSDWATLIGAFGGALIGVIGALCVYRSTVKSDYQKEKRKKIEYLNTACNLLGEICALRTPLLSAIQQYVDKVEKEPDKPHQLKETPLSLFLRFNSLNIEQFLTAWQELELDNKNYVLLFNSFDFIYNTLTEIYESYRKNNAELTQLYAKVYECNKEETTVNYFKNQIGIATDKNIHFIKYIQAEKPNLEEAFDRINTIKCHICKRILQSK